MNEAGEQHQPSGAVPASRLEGLRPYQPPAPAPSVDLLLDANEGAPPGDAVLDALRSVTAEDLRRYPDARPLEAELASRWGIGAERVVVTNGADDAIDRVCRAVLEPGRELLVHTPTFEMIERGARLAGGSVRRVPWLGGAFPAAAFLEAVSDETGLVALVTPNNPTGGVIGRDDLHAVVRAARGVGALVLIDLAYIEFASDDPTRPLIDEPNVVVTRTFSKALGLAGARLGYAIAGAEAATWLRTVGAPYPVSSMTAAIGAACLRAAGERKAFVERVRTERASLIGLLREFGCEVFDSEANFVAAAFGDAELVRRSLGSRGISVRGFASRPELSACLRITLPGEPGAFGRLETGLRAALAQTQGSTP